MYHQKMCYQQHLVEEHAVGTQLKQEKLDALHRLSHAGRDLQSLFAEVMPLLKQVIPFDAACWHTLDPATLLETSHLTLNLPVENPVATEIEYLENDYNQFATLVRSPTRSGVLSEATGGRPERSRRYRELIRPFGLEGELRAVLVTGGVAWGALGLLREGRDFRPDEAAFLHAASAPLGESIRRALLVQALAVDDTPTGPGLVLLNEEQRLEAMTPPAERLLSELVDVPAGGVGDRLPYVVHAVAARAQLAERQGPPAQARVRTRSGRWLVLHGSLLQGEGGTRTAVIVEEASAAGVAPILEQAYGLTAREAEVARLLLQGLSTKEIAAALYISPYTVQEHCTAIFEKVGVRGRRELVGRVFYQQYESRRLTGHRPGALGWFQQPTDTRGVDNAARA